MNRDSGSMDGPLLTAAIAAAAGGIWYLAGDWLVLLASAASAAVSLPAAWTADLLAPRQAPLLSDWLLEPSRIARDAFFGAGSTEDILARAAAICTAGGRNAALPLAVFCAAAAAGALGCRPDKACRRRHDLDSMIAEQAEVWPAAERPLRVDPSRDGEPETGAPPEALRERAAALQAAISVAHPQLPATGSLLLPEQPGPAESPPPLGRALKPDEWVDARMLRSGGDAVSVASAEAALAGQLSRRWTGTAALPAHEQAFCACLGQFSLHGPERAGKLIDRLSRAFAGCRRPGDCAAALEREPSLADVTASALADADDRLMKLARGHWWVETALVEIWRSGRRDGGVLAPARFLWMKPENRAVWYAIQTLGGNPAVEAAGIRAHHLAELQYGFACPAQHVLHAARALVEIYLDSAPERLAHRREQNELRNISLAERLDQSAAGA